MSYCWSNPTYESDITYRVKIIRPGFSGVQNDNCWVVGRRTVFTLFKANKSPLSSTFPKTKNQASSWGLGNLKKTQKNTILNVQCTIFKVLVELLQLVLYHPQPLANKTSTDQDLLWSKGPFITSKFVDTTKVNHQGAFRVLLHFNPLRKTFYNFKIKDIKITTNRWKTVKN